MDDAKCQQCKKFSALTVLGKKLGAPHEKAAVTFQHAQLQRKDGFSFSQANTQANETSVLVIRRMSCLLDAPVRVGFTMGVGRFYAFKS